MPALSLDEDRELCGLDLVLVVLGELGGGPGRRRRRRNSAAALGRRLLSFGTLPRRGDS